MVLGKLIFYGIFVMSLFFVVSLQAAFDGDRLEQNQLQLQKDYFRSQDKEREDEELEKRQEAYVPLDKLPTQHVGANCTMLQEVKIEGATKFSEKRLLKVIEPFNKECTTKDDWLSMRMTLENFYLERGYTSARVYFDFRLIKQKTLVFVIREGIISKLEFDEASRTEGFWSYRDDLSLITAFPLEEGEVLNMRSLEEGIDQMNRLSQNRAKVVLLPGDEPGSSTVEIHNQTTESFHVRVGADTLGATATGRNQYTTGITADDFIGFNDQLNIAWRANFPDEDPGHKNSKNFFANYNFPVGPWTFSTNQTYTTYASQTQGNFSTINFSGRTRLQNYEGDYMIFRDQKNKFEGGTGLALLDKKSLLEDLQLITSSPKLSYGFGLLKFTHYFQHGLIFNQLSYNQGTKWFGATPRLASLDGLATPDPQGKFGKIYGYYQTRIFEKTNYTFTWDGQYSHANLYGNEQFFVGGYGSVRGFQEVTYSGSSGYSIRNDLKQSLGYWIKGSTLADMIQAGLFADYGSVFPFQKPPINIGGAGISLGIIGRYGDITMAWSKPFLSPASAPTHQPVIYALANLRGNF